LGSVGFPRAYLRATALPSWWDDEIAVNPSGYAQALLILSRHLGLDLESLQTEDEPVRLRDFGGCKFKKRANSCDEEFALARVVATRAAQLAASAISTPIREIPPDAAQIRNEILGSDVAWVGLTELLDYCWRIGVPVLHLDHFPKNAKRPDGFAARILGRPVIVLCRNTQSSAWLLFILAHELGHLALDHVPDNGSLMDQRIVDSASDPEERDANAFATELLTGDVDRRFITTGRWPNAQNLARGALEIGKRQQIDPGHIVLNYAHSMGKAFFPVAKASSKLLEPRGDAVFQVRTKMAENLDWNLLPEDSSEFLMRVTKHRPPK
jgi:hypothetical protein